jgi:hypothetical protein
MLKFGSDLFGFYIQVGTIHVHCLSQVHCGVAYGSNICMFVAAGFIIELVQCGSQYV